MDFLPTKGIEYLLAIGYLLLLVPFWWVVMRREQPAVKPARERHDVGLARGPARELEGALVRLGARVAEERRAGERPGDELLRELLARLGAIEIGDVHPPGGRAL